MFDVPHRGSATLTADVAMMSPEALRSTLCRHFCADLVVKEIADGIAISTGMAMDSGDRITIVLAEDINGSYLIGDGDFLSTLEASDINIRTGPRAEFINSILKSAGAYWDHDTYEIRTETVDGLDGPMPAERVIAFLTALMRIRDVRYWTRDVVRSTFKADVTEIIQSEFGDLADIEESCPVNDKILLVNHLAQIEARQARELLPA
jgi:hypothetical protein